MPQASPPVALLALHGYSRTEIAQATDRSPANVSHILTGRFPWQQDVEDALLDVTGDIRLVAEIRGMARQSRLDNFKTTEDAS